MLLRKLFALHRLHDEVPGDTGDAGGGGGGGESSGGIDLKVDIAAASDAIGADLGLGEDKSNEGGDDQGNDGSATPPKKPEASPPADPVAEAKARAVAATALADAKKVLGEKKIDFAGKTDAEILALAKTQAPAVAAKALPKSWKAEQKAVWDKLSPEAQNYIEQREAQVEEGFKSNAAKVHYGEELRAVMQPYEALLNAQGVKSHGEAMKYLMNAHYVLSTGEPMAKAQMMAQIFKSYGVTPDDLNKALAAQPAAPDPALQKLQTEVKELRTHLTDTQKAELGRINDEAKKEVAAFAADPSHPHFRDCAEHIMLLLQDPKLSLQEAYDMAVWANPVTRVKEQERLTTAATEKARKEAEEKAAAAEKARGTRIRGDERHQASPDLLGSMEDTMRDTLKTINARS